MSALSDLAERVKTDILRMAGESEAAVREAFVSLATDASSVVAGLESGVIPTPDQAATDLVLIKNEALDVALLQAKKEQREFTASVLEYTVLAIKLLIAA